MFRDGEAGIMHPDSGFAFLPLEEEIVFDSTLYVPPVGSKNRAVQGELGKYKLDTGGGVLLHGTPHQSSIGKAATHGCMRLRDEDIEWLYQFVPVGTKLYIY
jgi:lipoprotein-anchoring transpeptidase ErfK/SrfK